MTSTHQHKYTEELLTPVLLFDCTLADGSVERWSTHSATWNGISYAPRVVENSGLSIALLADDGADWGNRMTVVLANTDGYVTRLHRSENLKGASVLASFAFLDPESGTIASTPEAVFTGIGDAPEELTTSVGRINFISRFSLQRLALPQTRIQEQCPWSFPRSAVERAEAVSGSTRGIHGRFYACGYSADQPGGCGNCDGGGTPYSTCAGTKVDCTARGMWHQDTRGQATARFGGFQFLPATSLVRSSGSSQRFWSQAVDGRARANDAVPLVYGTVRYPVPVIWAWSDGNFLICEALAGAGPMQGINRLWANGMELPLAVPGTNMSATGWYEVLTTGGRNGASDPNFTDRQGEPLGDPHGSLAVVSIHVPTGLISSNSLPTIEVLAQGQVLERYDEQGNALGSFFNSNPAWALFDILKRCGWQDVDLDIVSFAKAATVLDQSLRVPVAGFAAIVERRASFNYALLDRKPAVDIVRGLRQGAEVLIRLNAEGKISLVVEGSIGDQQPTTAVHSNASSPHNGGWSSFDANDGSSGDCTILANRQGDIDLRLFCQPTGQTPNRLTAEYQDSRNEYLNGSLSLVDLDDIGRAGSEVPGIFRGLGMPSESQARRVLSKELARAVDGNLFAEFSTTVKGLGMQPGDIITLTSVDYELTLAPFRVLRLSPGLNFETVVVLAQTHEDGWYAAGMAVSSSSTGWPSVVDSGTPFPIAGYTYSADGGNRFEMRESSAMLADGGANELVVAGFRAPRQKVARLAAPGIREAATFAAGGTLKPGTKALYYAITALDEGGAESRISPVLQVITGAMETGFSATVNGIVAPTGATGMRVYRGNFMFDLLYLADIPADVASWTDEGGDVSPMRPPDPRYDHANFYWRPELSEKLTIIGLGESTLAVKDGKFGIDQFAGSAVTVVAGDARDWQTTIAANTESAFTVTDPLPRALDVGDSIVIADPSWRLAGRSYGDQITWEAPNRAGLTIQFIGRSCTANGMEAPEEQSFLDRYTIQGGTGSLMDSRVPPAPASIVEAPSDGTIVMRSIATGSLTGTKTVNEGTLVTYSNDETSNRESFDLSIGLAADGSTLDALGVQSLKPNTYVQVDSELICINEPTKDGFARWIDRGVAGSMAASHSAGATCLILDRNLHMIPLGIGFFDNPAHGDFQYRIFFPNRRVAGAEFYLSNTSGTGPGQQICFISDGSPGLRTFEGSTLILQASGVISIERDATNSVFTDRARIVRDKRAFVDSAPWGGGISMDVTANGRAVATLNIPNGATQSEAFAPSETLAFAELTKLNLTVTGIPQGNATFTGKNLSVQIRT